MEEQQQRKKDAYDSSLPKKQNGPNRAQQTPS